MSEYERFLALAESRRSVRQFSDQDVSHEEILRILEAARWAPSNHNRQPWRFLVTRDRHQLKKLSEAVRTEITQKLKLLPEVAASYSAEFAHHATFFSSAPILITVLHKIPVRFSTELLKGLDHPHLISGEPLSAAMAVQNLLLAAHALGLGTCVMTAPLLAAQALRAELNPPPGYEMTCLVALGHAAATPLPPRRKNVEQIAEFREYADQSK